MSRPRPSYGIVHLAHTTFPDDPRPRREAMLAAETGVRVAVVVFRPDDQTPAVSRYGPLTVIRLRGGKQRSSTVRSFLEYLDFLLRARGLLARHPRFRHARIIHVHTLPDFLVGATGPARHRGAKIILDLHELFPEFTAARFGGWAGRVGEHVARYLEGWSRRRADVAITVNQSARDCFAGRPAMPGERIHVVHNFTDPTEFGVSRLTSGEVTAPLRLVYHGTITPMYGLDLAVAAVAALRRRGLEAELDIYGEGPDEARVSGLVREFDLTGIVRLRGSRSFNELRTLLPEYHAGLVPTRLDGMTRFSLSTKLLEYIHLGIPVIAPALETYELYFPDPCLWYFRPNDPVSAAEVIGQFADALPEERVNRARKAQEAAATRLDTEKDRRELLSIYRGLLAPES